MAVTVTLPEPDSRSGLASGLVVNPALAGVDVSICAAQSCSFWLGSSVKVSVAPCGARRVPSSPTPGAVPLRGRTVVADVPAAGQTRSVVHRSGARSMSAIGSSSMPLS